MVQPFQMQQRRQPSNFSTFLYLPTTNPFGNNRRTPGRRPTTMSVKLAVGVFIPGTHNFLTQAHLLMKPGLVPKKSSRPDQSKDLINIQGMGENRDV
jgi:DNA-directed RNA polymerase specialized sigma24 family protein